MGKVRLGDNDLKTRYPIIAKEWHPSKNGELKPEDVSYGSKKMVWWLCPKGHVYDMAVCKRTLRGSNCPICSGHRTESGTNDFATVYQEIAKEWHPTKNGDKTPDMFSSKNGYRAWWVCRYGHEWQATIHDRTSGTECPECKNRYTTSYPEQALFYYVKQLCPDAENRYKNLFDNGMEFDVYIPSRKVAIEFDGAYWHKSEESHKKERYKYSVCQKHGIFLFRIKEETGIEWRDVADVIYYLKPRDEEKLQNIIQGIIDTLDPVSNPWTKKNINKYHSDLIVNLKRDKSAILEYLKNIPNSLVVLRPDLVQEWHPTKNGKLTPDLFGINSNESAWWRCKKCGHEWKTLIIHRAGKRNSGCPECAKTKKGETFTKNKAIERGSLAEKKPELLKQWAYDLNKVLPTEIAVNYNKKAWWRCDICGYEWESSPNNRNKNVGCPCCSGRVPKIGENDLKTVNPDLAKEWDYSRNEKGPEEYKPNSGKKAWWICGSCGHSWEAEIRSRNRGHGCPECARIKRKK
jgi:rubrerythrin